MANVYIVFSYNARVLGNFTFFSISFQDLFKLCFSFEISLFLFFYSCWITSACKKGFGELEEKAKISKQKWKRKYKLERAEPLC